MSGHSTRWFLQTASINQRRTISHVGQKSGATVITCACRVETPRRQVRTVDRSESRIGPRYLVPAGTDVAVGDRIAASAAPAAGDWREVVAVGEQRDHHGAVDHLVVEVGS